MNRLLLCVLNGMAAAVCILWNLVVVPNAEDVRPLAFTDFFISAIYFMALGYLVQERRP